MTLNLMIIQVLPSLYTMMVPTFKPLTDIVIRLAMHPHVLEILQISNQNEVQVRVQLRDPEQLRALQQKAGCEVLFDYKFPLDGTSEGPATSVAVCVAVPFLLDVVRFCFDEGIDVKQVYDWYC